MVRRKIYVQSYPGPGGKWQISTEGGPEPVWNRNGRELFYRNGDKMIAVDWTLRRSQVSSPANHACSLKESKINSGEVRLARIPLRQERKKKHEWLGG